jgi:hypothetical protein
MKLIKRFWPIFLFALITFFFFYLVFLKGYLPFPGDLLTAVYKPWSTTSYLGYLPGTYPHKAQYFDTLRQIYPWKTLSLNLLKEDRLPLWNPYNFSGAPLLANFQSATFYPLNFFYFLLPQPIAWTILIILQPLLAGFFTYLLGREMDLRKKAALLAAIIYSFSGFMSVLLEYNLIGHTVLWLPLVFYFLEKLLKKQTPGHFLGLTFSLSLPFLAGHLPSAGLIFVFVLIYALFRLGTQKEALRKRIDLGLKIVFFSLLSLGLVAIQLVPTIELMSHAARTAHDYSFLIEKLLIQPKQLIMLLVPDFFGNPATHSYWLGDTYVSKVTYVGLLGLIFSLFASLFLWRNLFVRFFSLTAITIFGLIVSWPLTHLFYRLNIPLLATSSPTNAIFLIAFSLALLAGFGLDQWSKEKKKGKVLMSLVFFFSLGFLWLLILFWPQAIGLMGQFISVSLKNCLYSTLVFAVFVLILGFSFWKKGKEIALWLFLFLLIFDLFYFFRKFNPFVPQELVFPPTEVMTWLKENAGVNRFWGYGNAQIEANFATQEQVFSPDGYDPLYPARYGEFLSASKEGVIQTEANRLTRSDAMVAPGFGETNLVDNSYREKVLALLGVKYLLDREENGATAKTFPPEKYRLIWQENGWRIFENLKATPRAFLVGDYQLFADPKEFSQFFFAPDFFLQEKILLEEEPTLRPQSAKLATVEIKEYLANEVLLTTKTDVPQLLFLSDTFYPGWQALIDGQPTKIYRADYTFRAVAVPAGEHQVLFRYQPASLAWGVKISLISLLLLILVSFRWQKK